MSIKMKLRLTLYTVLTLLLLIVPSTLAQEDVTDDEVNDVAKGLYCPVCESTPLDACPTQACADWRELIKEQLASGMSKQEIFEYFSVQYGDGVLAEPPRRGFSLVLWIAPIVAVLLGGVVFVNMMRGLKEAPAAPMTAGRQTAVSSSVKQKEINQFVDRIEAELQELSNG